jgi:hypothetical protein
MNVTFVVELWVVLGVATLILAIYRWILTAHCENDVVHLGAGQEKAIPLQITLARKMNIIDRWGKSMTVITATRGEARCVRAVDREATSALKCCGFDSRQIILDTATPPATRVRAADSILDHTHKAIETEDIEERISELERSVEQASNSPLRKRSTNSRTSHS